MRSPGPWLKIALGGVLAGVLLVGGAAYGMRITDSRPFCATCHMMQTAAVTHKNSTHAGLACNECHAPANLVSKLPFKAQEGLRDFVNNLSGAAISIPVSLETKHVVNENCKLCHFPVNETVASMEAKPYCVDCHRSVAHMRQKPISTRMAANE